MTSPLPIVVLISGGGSTLENLLLHQRVKGLPIEFRAVISSRATVRGVQIARDAGIPTHVLRKKDFGDAMQHRDAVFHLVRNCDAQLVVMGGYLEHLLIPEDFEGRVVNIHPSLIPSFSGHGFYGLHVHQAAIDYGVKVSGCTVHLVDNQFDHGPIIHQSVCEVRADDTAESLQKRVFQLECETLPKVLDWFARGMIQWNPATRTVKTPCG